MTNPLMLINAPVVAGSAAVEDAGAATMGGTMAGAAGPVTAVLPPGAEDASAAAAAAFIARGAETEAMLTQLTTVRALFAQTMASSAAGYTAVDAINEATLAI
ncbi:PE domain-containing protein [Mycolicibacterium chlorophenolicum]|uniref:PE family protein n=1 Tax=Mycolicibacterium chlorophenolicum TaxID=37916 RepID=A0A0J6YA19_9MYCO|nr:PE domain-containing protein [Mycolicibacterium chlorophenolicum]KMO69791.1 PE family protein [Mycolicibacterium chlorophenolicum]